MMGIGLDLSLCSGRQTTRRPNPTQLAVQVDEKPLSSRVLGRLGVRALLAIELGESLGLHAFDSLAGPFRSESGAARPNSSRAIVEISINRPLSLNATDQLLEACDVTQ